MRNSNPTDLVSINDLMDIFQVKRNTILLWRSHNGLEDCRVPIGRDKAAVIFSLRAVFKWAKTNAKAMPGLAEWEKRAA